MSEGFQFHRDEERFAVQLTESNGAYILNGFQLLPILKRQRKRPCRRANEWHRWHQNLLMTAAHVINQLYCLCQQKYNCACLNDMPCHAMNIQKVAT